MLEVIDVTHHLPGQNSDSSQSSTPNANKESGSQDPTPPLLNKLSLNINRGESVAIVGASGAGKTTLLSFLAGLDVPSEGKVLLAGNDLTAMDEEGRAKVRSDHVAFVFQNFQLIDGLTALQNVCLPLEVKGVAKPTPKATEWLERVGLGHRLHHRPSTLSGGEQQRVALARAFACEAPLLFADEPTGSLDTRTGETVEALLFNLVKDQQVTLVLVTHDTKLAEKCDRTLVLKDGTLLEDGKHLFTEELPLNEESPIDEEFLSDGDSKVPLSENGGLVSAR